MAILIVGVFVLGFAMVGDSIESYLEKRKARKQKPSLQMVHPLPRRHVS